MKAWHFVGSTLRDGRPIPADGELLTYPTAPVLCRSGLHASLRPSQALEFAPGETLCLVECGGSVLCQPDKLVCTERTILTRMDATPLLRHYARMQALSVVSLWGPPQVVLDYLMTGDESIRDAAGAAAAWAAARDVAAWAAASAAASAAAWAARDAARYAARAAARDARDAARAAARDAARDARAEFDEMVYDAFEDWL